MIEFITHLSPGIWVALVILTFIGLVSQMSLYNKAGQPAISALVPVWNVMVFCKVVGRPVKHSLFLILPGVVIMVIFAAYYGEFDSHFPTYDPVSGEQIPGHGTIGDLAVPLSIIGASLIPIIAFMVLMFIEVCDSFGKHSTTDKILCIVFNGFYVLFALGVSQAVYEAPWWRKKRGLPYYIPDLKHKGKKILVTPEGPITGDPREQKVSTQIVDEAVADMYDADTAAKEHITSVPGADKKKKEDKPKKTVAEKKESVAKKSEDKVLAKEEKKPATSEASKIEDKSKAKSEAKKETKSNPPKEKGSSKGNDGLEKMANGRVSLDSVKDRYKKSDPRPKSDAPNWKDELKEKYKKKK